MFEKLKNLTMEQFRELPLIVEGESKEIRRIDDVYCVIYFKPTVYSFTQNRTGIVEGSNIPRIQASRIFAEVLEKAGIDHAYVKGWIGFGENSQFVISRIIKNPPNIETVVKTFHTGTSKHRYHNMSSYPVRGSHPAFPYWNIAPMEPYPSIIVRFDWRNPFQVNGKQMADEILPDEVANYFIDVRQAKETARRTYWAIQAFLAKKDIVIYDVCLFISEDGKTVFGEISPDCGRYRHLDLGSLDKDVWRTGGSSADIVEKWNLLVTMMSREKIFVVEGNDGTGKSTLAAELRKLGYQVKDRGEMTKATDDDNIGPADGHIYIYLDTSVEKCQERILARGDSITEKYHTAEDLSFYQRRYRELAFRFQAHRIDNTNMSVDETVNEALKFIETI